MSDTSERLRKTRQLLRAMTTVIARADGLGYEELIAVMDALKTCVAREAAARRELRRYVPRRPPRLMR